MANPPLAWFRMYTDFLNDPKMISLAFEDQRHFIAVLALKAGGVLDQECAPNVLDRIVAQRTWVDYAIVGDVKRRLVAAGLIAENWQPVAWEKRQMRSDSSAARVKAHRAKVKQDGNDHVTLHETLPKRRRNALEKRREEKSREEEKEKPTRARKRGASLSQKIQNTEPKPLTARALVKEGIAAEHARDWLTLRKAKRLPLTPTAWGNVKAEAALAGMTPPKAVEFAVKEGWAGFKASWVTKLRAEAGTDAAGDDTRWFETQDGVEVHAADMGHRPRKPDENWRSFRVLVVKAAGDRKAAEFVLADAQRFNDSRLYEFARNTFGDALMPVDDYAS